MVREELLRVLVTGAAGFIGSHVRTALTAAGHDVIGLDNLHPAAHGRDAVAPGGVIVGDIRDPDTVEKALSGVDAAVHHAAMVGMGIDVADMPDYVSCNDLGTAILLAAMARARITRLVLASSMVVYGEGAYSCPEHGDVHPAPRAHADLAAGLFDPRCPNCGHFLATGLVDEDAPLDPRSVYAATKLAQEHLAAAWARETGGTAAALRYHNVYGPGMPRDTPYAGVAAIFRSNLERGHPPHIFEDGAQRRDFIHVTDIASANLAALTVTNPPAGLRAYNIATGHPRTIADMGTSLARAHNGPAPIVTGLHRAGDVRHITASPQRAARELGFAATVDFDAGIAELAAARMR
jgi:dTDP-L-rhamnose 4-epimerase